MTQRNSKWSYVQDQPNAKQISLVIDGVQRKASASRGADGQYVVFLPAKELVDGSGQGKANPNVQGHVATFDKDGNLLKVDAVGWGAEVGFYNTGWPSKPDSVYNANAAKEYAPQVFRQMKSGGWLNKFQSGGMTPTQQPSQEQVMKELMSIVQQAATELQANKPGQGVQTLAQIASDPQGSQLLDALVQQVPEAGQIVEAVMKMIDAFKCGGKTKKKVKKGAKGCIPCKKLMRIGGMLTNVMVDCEGNIISKHQAGGRFIPKAEKGLTDEQLAMLDTSHDLNWAKGQAASVTTKTGKEGTYYYLGDDGNTLYSATSNAYGLDGNYRWSSTQIGDISKMDPTQLKSYGIAKNGSTYTFGNTWANDQINTSNAKSLGNLSSLGDAYTTKTVGAGTQQFYDGTGWFNMDAVQDASGNYYWQKGQAAKLTDFGDDDMRTGLTATDLNRGTITEQQATTAGINTSDFETGDGFLLKGNSLLGKTNNASDAVEKWGGMGTYRKINNWYKNARSQARKDAWLESNGNNDGKSFLTINKENKAKVKQAKSNYMSHLSKTLHDKWANYNVGTNAWEEGASAKSNPKPFDTTSKPVEQKAEGGWLTKFN